MYIEAKSMIEMKHAKLSSNRAVEGSAIYLVQTCTSISFDNITLFNNSASSSGTIKISGSSTNCSNFCTSCKFINNTASFGTEYSSSFYQVVVKSAPPTTVDVGQLFSLSLAAQDFYNNQISGSSLAITVTAIVPYELNYLGIASQYIDSNGVATFNAIALEGPAGSYNLQFVTNPVSTTVIVPIHISPCMEGYKLNYSLCIDFFI